MARLVFAMNLSLDGFVDHDRFAPDPALFRHWIDHMRAVSGSLYGRKLYELMRYWDEDQPGWSEDERAFASAYRDTPKWVVSNTLDSVGPNASLIRGDVVPAVRALKAEHPGEIDMGGVDLARRLGEAGLIDEYRLYYHPVVLGHGTPFFAGATPALRLTGCDRIGLATARLTYVPA